MEQWQDAASQQVKLISNRLNELLSKGLELVRSELGVDLGLKPELIPPWMILFAACTGLVLMVALWASVCRALFKKGPALRQDDESAEIKREVVKTTKPEEPKKKKKKAEKKAQPNGRAVAEAQDEAMVSEEMVPHHHPPPPEVKADKVEETKKPKKKAKQASKESKTVTTVGKEPEEGTWETKVSNKEKREQRKKDKGSSDGSASPGGGDTPVSSPQEKPNASVAPIAPAAPTAQKKKKGESTKVKAEKVEAVVSQVNSREVTAVAAAVTNVPAAVTNVPAKVPAHGAAKKTASWTTSREPATVWRPELDDSWTVIEKGTELNLSFAGVGAAEPKAVSELSWLSQPRVDDEWSGLNGGSADPSSDWNAPSEAWGNYEEPSPTQEHLLPEPAKVNLLTGATEEEDEKDKAETNADGVAKTKKKKKKKKKAAEDGGAGQGEEPEKEAAPAAPTAPVKKQPAAVQPVKAAAVEVKVERSMKDNPSQKLPVTQVPQKPVDVEPAAKQNNLPPPTQQKKPEDSQAPKPAKKKKARRDT